MSHEGDDIDSSFNFVVEINTKFYRVNDDQATMKKIKY